MPSDKSLEFYNILAFKIKLLSMGLAPNYLHFTKVLANVLLSMGITFILM